MYKKRLLVGLCSWNNYKLLKIFINNIITKLDLSKDGIAVVLNESDIESITFLHQMKIPFVSIPENRGVLAIDYLIPFIQNCEYFLNTNDDMIFHEGFSDDLINIIDKNYPCSASCLLVENFNSYNPCVFFDKTLTSIYDENTVSTFLKNVESGKYFSKSNIITYNHPICVKSIDYLRVGGYSGYWDMDFSSGYGRDDMFAIQLYKLHNQNFKFIGSKKSFVFHESSASMKRLSPEIRSQSNTDKIIKKSGIDIHTFKQMISCFNKIDIYD